MKAAVFPAARRSLIDAPAICRSFMHRYHSPRFEKYAQEENANSWARLLKTAPLFRSGEDAGRWPVCAVSPQPLFPSGRKRRTSGR